MNKSEKETRAADGRKQEGNGLELRRIQIWKDPESGKDLNQYILEAERSETEKGLVDLQDQAQYSSEIWNQMTGLLDCTQEIIRIMRMAYESRGSHRMWFLKMGMSLKWSQGE